MGRCLKWGAINSRGAFGGVLVFWDNRVLQLLEVEGGFSQSHAGLRTMKMTFVGIL